MKTIGEIFEETNSDYLVVKFIETENWSDDIRKLIHDAYGVYLIKNEPTHLCDYQTNYPATFLYNALVPKNDENLDEIYDAECENDGDDTINYYSEHTKPNQYHVPTESELGNEDTTEEEIREYFICNRVI